MKKTIGIILLVIVGLNFFSIMVRSLNGVAMGLLPYYIFLVIMLIGGIRLINNSNNKKNQPADILNKQSE